MVCIIVPAQKNIARFASMVCIRKPVARIILFIAIYCGAGLFIASTTSFEPFSIEASVLNNDTGKDVNSDQDSIDFDVILYSPAILYVADRKHPFLSFYNQNSWPTVYLSVWQPPKQA
ncbi:hypothetical protein SAMN05216323_11692 [Williamwhitmania taraxaci]|uniref:Uncharacterized protein n=2 Tax=Williamwhitmania taraxaci TaxID=1640674 RepID=A0A1G6UDS7_9BACT|nr:hypothetical protein SAMN05216323_11692 [Williamwhitmania taraxaci]